jgi:hypothetical protein
MACKECENVGHHGPTQKQQYVDPFAVEPAPRYYTCPYCNLIWWCTAETHIGFWVPIKDREAFLATLNGLPVLVSEAPIII